MLDNESGEIVFVSDNEVASSYQSRKFDFVPSETYNLVNEKTGTTRAFKGTHAPEAMAVHYAPESEDAKFERIKKKVRHEEYGGIGQQILTGVQGAARGATFGLLDLLADEEETNRRMQENPTISTVSEIGGAIVPMFGTGGASLAARGVAGASGISRLGRTARLSRNILRATPAGQAARLAEGIALKAANRGLVARTAMRGAGTAIEGSLHGATRAISTLALNEDVGLNGEFISSHLLPGMLQGAAIGGVAGAAGEVIGAGLTVAGKKAASAADEFATKASQAKLIKNVKKIMGTEDEVFEATAKSATRQMETTEALIKKLDDVIDDPLMETATREALQTSREALELSNEALYKRVGATMDDTGTLTVSKDAFKKIKPEAYMKTATEDAKLMNGAFDGLESAGHDIADIKAMLKVEPSKFMKKLENYEIVQTLAEMGGLQTPGVEDIPVIGGALQFLMAGRLAKGKLSEIAGKAGTLQKVIGKAKDIPIIGKKLGALTRVNKLAQSGGMVSKAGEKLEGQLLKFGEGLSKGVKKGITAGERVGKVTKRIAPVSAVKLVQDSPTLESLRRPLEDSTPRLPGNQSDMVKSFRSETRDSQKELMDFRAKVSGLINTNSDQAAQRAVIAALGDEAENFPELAAQIYGSFKRKVDFLKSKVPSDPMSEYTMGDSGWKPTKQEMMKFSRYVKAVDSPMSLMEDIMLNEGSAEAAEAVRTVYPVLYQKMQIRAAEMIVEKGATNIPRNIRLGIAATLQIPVDPTTTTEFLMEMSKLQTQTPVEPGATSQGGPTGAPKGAPNKLVTGVDMNEETSVDRIGGK